MAPSKVGVVLVHGAWHTNAWNGLPEKIEAEGYRVEDSPLVSASYVDVEDSLAKDTAAVKQSIQKITNSGQDVVLIMHSQGGLCGSEAVAEFFQDPACQGADKGRIVQLLYISGMVIDRGVSVMSEGLTPHAWDIADGLLYHLEPYNRFYNTTPPAVARQAIAKLTPQVLNGALVPSKHCGWKDHGVPVDYIVCEQDRALLEFPRFVGRLRDAGVLRKEHRIDCDHTPWLSAEEDFMSIVWEVLEHASSKS